jgi:ribonuclease Z
MTANNGLTVTFLGTANAIPDELHQNTSLVLSWEQRMLLIDSGNNPVPRLQQAGLDVRKLTDLLVTHFHPDHVGGIPALLMDSWLLGRQTPLQIWGLEHTLTRLQQMVDLFGWQVWPGFQAPIYHILPLQTMMPLYEDDLLQIVVTPVKHLIPALGLRVIFKHTGGGLAFSGDSEPCDAMAQLATGAEVLIHEASGAERGHSSAQDAGRIARQAGVGRLYLTHYSCSPEAAATALVSEAQQEFTGSVTLAQDLMKLEL